MSKVVKTSGALLCAMLLSVAVQAGPIILSQGFDDITTLPGSGWALVNNSSPLGITGWFQGNSGVFPASSGGSDSYIAANFENAAAGGNISNWLLTPEMTMSAGDVLSFSLRSEGAIYGDTIEVRYSTAGLSTDVGNTDASVGVFSNFLLSVLWLGGGDPGWLPFSLVLPGSVPVGATGRYAFRYVVMDTSVNGDYIGIDDVSVESASVPDPGSTLLLLSMSVTGLVGLRRRRR